MNNLAISMALRLIHIVSGVLWVGAATMLAAYVVPAARASDDGMRYMRQLIWVRNLPRYLNVVLGLSVLSGLLLYGNFLMMTRGAWLTSRRGIVLGLGGLAAIIAAAVATFVAAPAIHRALQLAEKGPSERDVAAASLRRYGNAMWLVVALLLGTASMMAISRYF
ncbi:MAG TPA: hypothetical protein VN706_03025 [Gemmatimonadaceae bacterium]|nr:hypothetical protein [Gemmatimonadaceae bacterium]